MLTLFVYNRAKQLTYVWLFHLKTYPLWLAVLFNDHTIATPLSHLCNIPVRSTCKTVHITLNVLLNLQKIILELTYLKVKISVLNQGS